MDQEDVASREVRQVPAGPVVPHASFELLALAPDQGGDVVVGQAECVEGVPVDDQPVALGDRADVQFGLAGGAELAGDAAPTR